MIWDWERGGKNFSLKLGVFGVAVLLESERWKSVMIHECAVQG